MLLDQGTYWGTLTGAGLSTTQRGTVYFYLEFNVAHIKGGAGDFLPIAQPATRTVQWFCSDAAWPHTEEKLQKLGFNGDFGEPKFERDLVEGIELSCKHEWYDGKQVERWDCWLNDGGGGWTKQAPEKAEVRRLNALWKQGAKKPAGKPAAPPAAAPAASKPAPPPFPSEGPELDKQGAWDALLRDLPESLQESGDGKAQISEAWATACTEVFGDRHEDEGSSADWHRVLEAAKLVLDDIPI